VTAMEYYRLLENKCEAGLFPAADGFGVCCYRVKDTGAACVIGLLISADVYNIAMEDPGVENPLVRNAVTFPEGVTMRDLVRLQRAHDKTGRLDWSNTKFLKEAKKILKV